MIPTFVIALALFLKWNKTAIAATAVLVLLLFFYRGWVPGNDFAPKDNEIVSPCDGRILNIRHHRGHLHIAIFLNVHNIHVQYAPIKGKIESQHHFSGTFVPAYMFEKSMLNERLETGIKTRHGRIFMTQIAGLLARRIVAFKRPGERIRAGEPIGLIKFGSRVDLWIPDNRGFVLDPKWRIGSRIRIGETVGEFN